MMPDKGIHSSTSIRRSAVSNLDEYDPSVSRLSDTTLNQNWRLPTALSESDIFDRLTLSANNVAEVFKCSPQATFALLPRTHWNESKLVALLLAEESILEEFDYESEQTIQELGTPRKCEVCEQQQNIFVKLGCPHEICLECTKKHLKVRILAGECTVGCMVEHCPIIYLIGILTMVLDGSIFFLERVKAIVIKLWLDQTDEAIRCRSSGCQIVLLRNQDDQANSHECECPSCEERYCWKCKKPTHWPMNCQQVKQWQNIHTVNSKSLGWLASNTKKCPKCGIIIEKNGGCNHMICPVVPGCGTHFCYACGGLWDQEHIGFYQCQNATKLKKPEPTDSQNNLSAISSFDKYERAEEKLKKWRAKGELVEATKVFLVNEAEKTEILGWGKFLVQIACLLKNSFPYLLLRSGKSKDYETLMDDCCMQFSFAHRQITEGVEDLRWNYVTFPMEVPEREAQRRQKLRHLFIQLVQKLRTACRELSELMLRMQQTVALCEL